MSADYEHARNFTSLVGKIPLRIVTRGEDQIYIFCIDTIFLLTHRQYCCESVYIEDVCGDFDDLIGAPIVVAEEASNTGTNPDISETWTFYKIDGPKGGVVIRWYGTSNGFYSESASILELTEYSVGEYRDVVMFLGSNLFNTSSIENFFSS